MSLMRMRLSNPAAVLALAAAAAVAVVFGSAPVHAAAAGTGGGQAPKAAAAGGNLIEGRVTHVSDGDSLFVQTGVGGKPLEVRIAQIDAPEICQAGGPAARDALRAMVDRREVLLQTVGRTEFGRTLARVSLDGNDIGKRMVEEGHAWSSRTKWDRGPLVREERMAQALKRGLHAEPGAVMPREFRRGHGACERSQAPTSTLR